MQAEYDARNPPALRRLVESGVQLHRFSDDIMQAAQRETTDLLETTAATDPRFRRIYEQLSGADLAALTALGVDFRRSVLGGSAAGFVPFVLVLSPGHVTPGHDVPDRDLRAAVEELAR